eukprot:gb/GECG01012159.1/.p1 GENE.gb/GECG01012159.1/~~gb/GECG01012159.1/.p1  ORF type:complete len:156 (+),score=25.66 gb/GECG01012159.1/:1-468(+)
MAHERKAENKLASHPELSKAYPIEGESDLLKKLGGNLEHRENNSALRISAVLNRTGLPLDRSSNYTATKYEDKEGNIYALDVQELHEILKKMLGPPRHIRKQEDAVKFKGIILFEGVPSIKDQTGHFDLWNGKTTESDDYWTSASNIWIWNAPAE